MYRYGEKEGDREGEGGRMGERMGMEEREGGERGGRREGMIRKAEGNVLPAVKMECFIGNLTRVEGTRP